MNRRRCPPVADPLHTYWTDKHLPNGIRLYVEYVYDVSTKDFIISNRSQILIDKALEMTYNNRDVIKEELETLAKILGVYDK